MAVTTSCKCVNAFRFKICNKDLVLFLSVGRDAIGRIPTNQKLLSDLLEMLGEFGSAMSSGYMRQIYTESQTKRRQSLFVPNDQSESDVRSD